MTGTGKLEGNPTPEQMALEEGIISITKASESAPNMPKIGDKLNKILASFSGKF